MNVEKVDQPKLAQHDATFLDLAFCMDCTGSMGSYIANARNVIIKFSITLHVTSFIFVCLIEH